MKAADGFSCPGEALYARVRAVLAERGTSMWPYCRARGLNCSTVRGALLGECLGRRSIEAANGVLADCGLPPLPPPKRRRKVQAPARRRAAAPRVSIEVKPARFAPWAPAIDGWQPAWAWRVRVGTECVTGATAGSRHDANAQAAEARRRLEALQCEGFKGMGIGAPAGD